MYVISTIVISKKSCSPVGLLDSLTHGISVFNKVDIFFACQDLDWRKVGAVYTDGAPSMLGSHSGFQVRVKQVAPGVITNHCMIHREALASKTLPASLKLDLEEVIKIVNFVKSSALNFFSMAKSGYLNFVIFVTFLKGSTL